MAKFNLISDVPNIVYHVKLMSEYFGIRHYIGVNFIYYPFCEISVFDKLDLYSKCKSEEYEVWHHFFRCILCTPNFTVISVGIKEWRQSHITGYEVEDGNVLAGKLLIAGELPGIG